MEFIGRTVRKEFKVFGVFIGVVKSYDSSSGFFEIGYDDGDSEEIDLSELTVALVDGDAARTDHSPYRVKRRRVPVSSNSGNKNVVSVSVAVDECNLTGKLDFSSNNNNVSDCCDNLNSNGSGLNCGKVNGEGIDLNSELTEENDLETKGKVVMVV